MVTVAGSIALRIPKICLPRPKATRPEALGPARPIACRDAIIAQTVASDRRLRALRQLAGDRHLVFRPRDETAVRRTLRELGHVLPPAR